MSGTLFVCGTPIGNLEDVTLRLLRILGEVDLIAAEDTRQSRKLLSRYDLHTPLISLNKDNERGRIPEILVRLQEGSSVALVSDAGMPGISDPGELLVRACVDDGIQIEVIPGPTASISALVISGLPTGRFLFLGFAPRQKNQRLKTFSALRDEPATLIFYEAPHRITAFLKDLLTALGDRQAALARELTKVYEEVRRGTISELLASAEASPPKGEIVVVIEGNVGGGEAGHDTEEARLLAAETLIAQLLQDGAPSKQAATSAAAQFGIPSRTAYDIALRLKKR